MTDVTTPEPKKAKPTSTEKLATRSNYERGKLDGLAEAVELLREREQQIIREAQSAQGVTEFHKLSAASRDNANGYRKAADALWTIYKRRVI